MTSIPINTAPWDRREEEPELTYLAFLTNRILGPSRSIDLAYRRFRQAYPRSTGVPRRTSVPGNWGAYSVRFDWVQSAQAWDIWRLKTYGSRVAVLFTYSLERTLEKLADALDRFNIGDPEWMQILDTFEWLKHDGGWIVESLIHANKAEVGSN
jgi:hypothetical protein